MLALTLNPIATTVKTAAVMPDFATGDVIVNLPPLADGTSVQGVVSEGVTLCVTAEWHGRTITVDFTEADKPHIEIDDDDEQLFPVAAWRKRRKVMADLLTNNIVEQVVERAKAWQPQLFN